MNGELNEGPVSLFCLSVSCQSMYGRYTTTPRWQTHDSHSSWSLFKTPLIWFKVQVAQFYCTWGFYFLVDCYHTSKFCTKGLPERCWREQPNCLLHPGTQPTNLTHTQGAITTGSNFSAPERSSNTNMEKKSKWHAKKCSAQHLVRSINSTEVKIVQISSV